MFRPPALFLTGLLALTSSTSTVGFGFKAAVRHQRFAEKNARRRIGFRRRASGVETARRQADGFDKRGFVNVARLAGAASLVGATKLRSSPAHV
jgi:hypothetical protein